MLGISADFLVLRFSKYPDACFPFVLAGIPQIDTEGFENFVLRGARKSILGSKVPFLVIEFYKYMDRRDEAIELLTAAGYKMSTKSFYGDPWKPEEYHKTNPSLFDVYCWHPDF